MISDIIETAMPGEFGRFSEQDLMNTVRIQKSEGQS